MMFWTHLAFSFLVALILLPILNPFFQSIFVLIVLFASLIPDIDAHDSKLGRYFWPFSLFFKHRGFTHALTLPILFIFLLAYYAENAYIMAFCAGYLSHIICDMATRNGIPLLYPFSKFRFSGFIKSGGIIEHIVFGLLLVLDFVLLFN